MESLNLESPPDLDDQPISAALWSELALQRFIKLIQGRFRTRLDPAAINEMATFADLAALVQHSLEAHQGPAAGG
jgi:hypothetical protein